MVALTHLTPYVTPEILLNAPTGISWKTIPSVKADPSAQLAEQMNICSRATSMVDTACNNIMRSTIDVEQLRGPDFRVTQNISTGVTRLLMSRYPVTSVISGRITNAASFPPNWTSLPATSFQVERPPLGVTGTTTPSSSSSGGQGILMAPGNLNWWNGRNGFLIEVTYTNGWPHTALTTTATQGSSTLAVNDCTGWAPSDPTLTTTAIMYDGTNQEVVSVNATSVTSGPGNLTLSIPLTYTHSAGVVVSSLPSQLMQATILFAVSEALVRGATATTIQTISGTGQTIGMGDHWDLKMLAHELCMPYKRVI